jgi:SAM-dependent methyltransferase
MFGFLLDEAKRSGLSTFGVELARDAADVAAAKGHDVHVGTIEEFAQRRTQLLASFDVIFAQHVLEHIAEPRAFLETARSLLRPSGRLVLCVPNFEARLRRVVPNAWGWYQVPVHLQHYSGRALQHLLNEKRFSALKSETRGGDSLFLMLTALQAVGTSAGRVGRSANPAVARVGLRLFGDVTRFYHALGDDELAVVAEVQP